MNQLFIAGNVAYPLAAADYMALANGAIGIFDKAGALVSTALSGETEFVSLVLGRGTKQPLVIDEVDLKTLSVVKGAYIAATTFASTMTIPTPTAGKEYGIIVIKKGTVFNERNTWTFLELAKTGDTATTVADRLVKAITANTVSSGVTASNVAGAITITASEAGVDYTVVGAEELFGVAPTAVTQGIEAYGDAKYIQNLASKAAAGKGFNYTYPEGVDIYPGYPESVPAASYTIYTLRFATSSKARTIETPIPQIVQIAVPTGAAQIATLDTIFGIA